jgi:hypothetical protein
LFSSSFWKSTEEVSAQNEPRRFWCKKVQEDKSAMELDAGHRHGLAPPPQLKARPVSTSSSINVKISKKEATEK